jgi:alanyl-tRNA synthetase
MENKLYYQDTYIQTFSTLVLNQDKDEAGNWYVILQQTAFYPTGGGQPHDVGTFGGRKVVKVEEINGEIRHYLDGPLTEREGEVVGSIDWARRFDHMQQHAGQHILTAAFESLFHYKTVSFHLGIETLTIDIETEQISAEEALIAEELANQIILENRPIETRWVTEAELSQYSLRKETKVKEDIRLVIIPGYDYNGCGGTHPKATGEVRAIKILDWERQKKNIRVQFVCGDRVLAQLHQKQNVLQSLTKLLNAPETDMEHAVQRIIENGKILEKALEQAEEKLLEYEATELLAAHENKIVSKIYQNRSIQTLQKLARIITTKNASALVFLVSKNENRLQLVCARGTARTESMKKLLGETLPLINGKGGGNEAFAQGGGEATLPEEKILQVLLQK